MKRPNYITLYKSLTAKETKDFAKFLYAFLSADSIPIKVFEYLNSGDSEERWLQLKEKKELKKIFLLNKTPTKSLSNTFYDLQKYLEDFLVFQKLKSENQLHKRLLLEVFQEKKLEDFEEALLAKALKEVEAKKNKDATDYYHAMRLNEFQFYNSRTPKFEFNTGIEKCMESLDLFFVTAKFKLAAEVYNRQNVVNEQFDISFLEEAETFLKQYNTEKAPAGTLFHLAYLFNKNDSEKDYQVLKTKFFSHIDQLNETTKNILMSYLINYTAREIRKGNSSNTVLRRSFDLHQLGIEKRMFITDGYFPPAKFTNIVELACQLKEFDWATAFIKKWAKYVHKPIQKAVTQVSKAIIEFEKKNYSKVLAIELDFKHRDVFLKMRLKLLVIKTLCETGKDEQKILDHCHNLDVYLNRKKIAQEALTRSGKNFAKIVRKSLHPDAKWEQTTLLQELEHTELIAYKIWLKKRINKLK